MILIDNTVLSNFALIRHPTAIQYAFSEPICTTEQVFQELKQGMKLQHLPKFSWEWLEVIEMTEVEATQFTQLQRQLDKGEASCLAVASQRQWKIATDDKDARKWAIRLQIPHTGTLGILGVLVVKNYIGLDEGNTWLASMIEAGYRSPMSTLDELVQGK